MSLEFFGITIDITGQKKREEMLQKSMEKLRLPAKLKRSLWPL